MPRPNDLTTLWQPAPAPAPQRPNNLTGWWDHYCQARTFVPVGLGEITTYYGANRKGFLTPFIPDAIRKCSGDWAKTLTYKEGADFWKECTSGQLADALVAKPMCLSKLGIAITAVELFAEARANEVPQHIDIYDFIYIGIGSYRIQGLTKAHAKHLSDHHQDKLAQFRNGVVNLVRPGMASALLQDVTHKQHNITHEVAQVLCESLSTKDVSLVPVLAQRHQSGMRPTSKHLAFVPPPLPGQ